jgi:hypothetical protein
MTETLSPQECSEIESAFQERLLAEHEICRQSLQDKEEEVRALTQKVAMLEEMLERFNSLRTMPVAQSSQLRRPIGPPPRRWSARN